jgi:GNAT superfamily N-acetyltransferase
VDGILALVGRCDRTYLEWAPAGWRVPDLELDRPRWEESWLAADRWSRGAMEPAGRLVAMVSWRPERDADSQVIPGSAHVSALFVDPSRWREGIAAELMSTAEGAMRRSGNRRARLWTPEDAPARRFYEATGWKPDGRRSWHEPLGLPVVGYEKRIRRALPSRAQPV